MEKLIIAGKEFSSRLFLGTGKFSCNELMAKAIEASETEMVTMAMKRIELGNDEDDMMKHIAKPGIQLLPNTSGTRNAEEAVVACLQSSVLAPYIFLSWSGVGSRGRTIVVVVTAA